ncbi:MAG: glycosyltransferase [Candidatus Omnitrophica bacterium]|nr:glycosyltransferase [Candidatus Omnitrophota bacterium]
MPTPSVSLVLPMFNEKGYIRQTIAESVSVLGSCTSDFEIIIVDDASDDGSQTIADELSRQDKRIKVVHHGRNRKLGGALKTGFSCASKEVVVYADMDMPFDFSLLKKFIPLAREADIINGYRLAYRESFKRRLYSKAYNLLIKALFGLKVRDVNFSMKIFKKSVLASLVLKSEGSFISAEVLIKAQYRGYRIIEVPAVYHPRHWSLSRLSSLGVILKIVYEMAELFPSLLSLRVAMGWLRLKAHLHNYVRMKTCPFKAIEPYVPLRGDVYDLGCGYGTFISILSRRHNPDRSFIGFDIDEAKIKFSSLSNRDGNIRFERRDIGQDLGISDAACIMLLDVLCLVPFIDQERLLERCFGYLSDSGFLIIKDIETRPFWKYIWHGIQVMLELKVFKLVLGQGLYCRSRENFISLLERTGYAVDVKSIQRGYPYPHVLYVCRKH